MSEADPEIVRCRGVTKSYGTRDAKVPALRGIDLDVQRGELLMLVGPSGCGKTTLISVIAAILDRDGGECAVLGRDLQRMDATDRAHFRGASIGFVFQAFNLLPALMWWKTLRCRFWSKVSRARLRSHGRENSSAWSG